MRFITEVTQGPGATPVLPQKRGVRDDEWRLVAVADPGSFRTLWTYYWQHEIPEKSK